MSASHKVPARGARAQNGWAPFFAAGPRRNSPSRPAAPCPVAQVRLLDPGEEVEMLTYTGHRFEAVGDGGHGARLLRFLVQPGVGRYLALHCADAATAARAVAAARASGAVTTN